MCEQTCVKEGRCKLAGTRIHAEPLHGCPIIYSDASTLAPHHPRLVCLFVSLTQVFAITKMWLLTPLHISLGCVSFC